MNVVNMALFKEQLMDKGHLDTTITSWCSQVKASFFYFSFSLCFSPACVLLHLMCGFVTGEVATILEAKLKPDRNLRSRSSLGCTSSFPRSRQDAEGAVQKRVELAPLESVGIVEPLESGKNKSQMHSANLHHLANVQLGRCSPQYFSSRSSNWQLTGPLNR